MCSPSAKLGQLCNSLDPSATYKIPYKFQLQLCEHGNVVIFISNFQLDRRITNLLYAPLLVTFNVTLWLTSPSLLISGKNMFHSRLNIVTVRFCFTVRLTYFNQILHFQILSLRNWNYRNSSWNTLKVCTCSSHIYSILVRALCFSGSTYCISNEVCNQL